jgi:hypothetical protein
VLNVLVAEVSLKRAGVMSLGCESKPAGVPQHVRVGLEAEICLLARPLDHARKACGAERCATFRGEYEGRLGLLLALQPPQPPQLVAEDRMRAGAALLDPADVQRGRVEVDLIPAQVRQLGRSQAMPIGHKDHRAVPVTPAVSLGGLEQSFDLRFRQIFAGSQVGIGTAGGRDCSFFGGWRDQLQVRFGQGFTLSG